MASVSLRLYNCFFFLLVLIFFHTHLKGSLFHYYKKPSVFLATKKENAWGFVHSFDDKLDSSSCSSHPKWLIFSVLFLTFDLERFNHLQSNKSQQNLFCLNETMSETVITIINSFIHISIMIYILFTYILSLPSDCLLHHICHKI